MAVENFDSLRDDLQKAIQKIHGKDAWIDDFSTTEAIFHKPGKKGRGVSDGGSSQAYAVPYTLENGGVKFTGKHYPVKRVSGWQRVHKDAVHKLEGEQTVSAAPKGGPSD